MRLSPTFQHCHLEVIFAFALLQPHSSRAMCCSRVAEGIFGLAELSTLTGWDVQEPLGIVRLHSLISGTSICETCRVLAPLLPALDPPGPLPGRLCPSRRDTRRGITLVRLGCFPHCSWEICPTSQPGHPLLLWVIFFGCGLVTDSFPCVVWPLLKEAAKKTLTGASP